VRHRRDAGQRFAAEPERPDRAEVVGARDLARRVPLDRQPRVLRLHPLAVVFDANQLLAAELDGDGDARAPASSAFSTSSLTTEAGRSTTSPAAIWLARSGEAGGSDIQIHPMPILV
jgi:hypothetical protein